MIHKYPQWHDAMKKNDEMTKISIWDEDLLIFFGDWGLTHGISILAALA